MDSQDKRDEDNNLNESRKLDLFESQMEKENNDFEEYLYNRRQRLNYMRESFQNDPIIDELYEERRQILDRMENDFLDYKDEQKKFINAQKDRFQSNSSDKEIHNNRENNRYHE